MTTEGTWTAQRQAVQRELRRPHLVLPTRPVRWLHLTGGEGNDMAIGNMKNLTGDVGQLKPVDWKAVGKAQRTLLRLARMVNEDDVPLVSKAEMKDLELMITPDHEH
jgi:hypothetical protein